MEKPCLAPYQTEGKKDIKGYFPNYVTEKEKLMELSGRCWNETVKRYAMGEWMNRIILGVGIFEYKLTKSRWHF